MKTLNTILRFGVLTSLLIFSFSCSEEDDKINGKQNGSSDSYLSLRLSTPDNIIFTRATDDFEGTVGERMVSSIHMLLYSVEGPGSKLLYNLEINASADGINKFSGQDVVERGTILSLPNQFVSRGKPIVKQDYQLVVLVNASAKVRAKIKAEADYPSAYNILGDLLEVIEDTKPNEYYDSKEENFFMSNAGGVVFIPKSSLGNHQSEAEENPTSVYLERLLAKILVYNNKNTPLENVALGGKIGAVTWGLDNTNKKTNLIRGLDKLKSGAVENGFETDRSLVYANDPSFDNNSEIAADSLLYSQHFDKLDISDTAAFIPWNISGQDVKNYRYVLENTISAADQRLDATPKKYTTQVLLKVIITEPNGLTGATDYYSYFNGSVWKVFTHKQAVEWFAGGVSANQSFPEDMVGLSAIITQANNGSEFDFTVDTGMPKQYLHTEYGLTFHAGGLNVYSVPIKHFGAEDQTLPEEHYGYYGVVRNNTYRIIINSINGPGTMTEYENISTAITINNWYNRETNEDL